MGRKSLTKDCPSCHLMIINDDNQFVCTWGKNKKIKILDDKRAKKVLNKCTLRR